MVEINAGGGVCGIWCIQHEWAATVEWAVWGGRKPEKVKFWICCVIHEKVFWASQWHDPMWKCRSTFNSILNQESKQLEETTNWQSVLCTHIHQYLDPANGTTCVDASDWTLQLGIVMTHYSDLKWLALFMTDKNWTRTGWFVLYTSRLYAGLSRFITLL
jgi:hypothetical protein